MSDGTITTEQRAAMAELFQQVKSADQELAPYEIIHRMSAIKKITVDRAITGYKLMRQVGIIPDAFIKGGKELEAKILKTFYTPVMCDLLEKFGLTIKEVRKAAEPLRILKRAEDRQLEITEALVDTGMTAGIASTIASHLVDHEQEIKQVEKVKDAIASKLLGLDANF